MDYVALIEQAGLKVVNGHMRLSAALGAGMPVTAADSEGAVYQISVRGTELVVEELPEGRSSAAMLMVQRVELAAPVSSLADPKNWEKVQIPSTLGNRSALWAIRECDLLRLMSIKNGATYTSVRDGAIRAGVAVRRVDDLDLEESPDLWQAETSSDSTCVYYSLWAVREQDLLMLLNYSLGESDITVAEAVDVSDILMRPVPPQDDRTMALAER